MTKPELLQELTIVFRDVFNDDSLQIDETMTAENVSNWDSLHHINLIVAIESEFGIKFRTSEIEKLTNVGDLLRAIEQKAH
jgi:acyl carrier protein